MDLITCTPWFRMAVVAMAFSMAVPAGVDGQALYFGGTVGWGNTSQISDERQWGRIGHAVGLAARLSISDALSLQVEVQEVERGFGERNVGTRMHQRYREVPVLLVTEVPLSWEWLSPELTVGLAPAQEQSCETWYVLTAVFLETPSPPDPIRLPCSYWRNRTSDLGAVFGGGVSIDIGPSLVSVWLRHTRGTKPVWESRLVPRYNRAMILGVTGMIRLWSRD